jgi:hypothetical protein
MPRRKNLLALAFSILILALFPALLSARPAQAKVDLQAGKGEAVWFYRSCTPALPGAAATWKVELNPSVSNLTSLSFQVKNAYPGYQLACELYFANSGKLKIWIKEIRLYNPNDEDLLLSAVTPSEEQGKLLKSCGFRPAWGKNPISVPSNCQSKIKLILTIGPNADENSRLDFAVRVRLEEKPDAHQ